MLTAQRHRCSPRDDPLVQMTVVQREVSFVHTSPHVPRQVNNVWARHRVDLVHSFNSSLNDKNDSSLSSYVLVNSKLGKLSVSIVVGEVVECAAEN